MTLRYLMMSATASVALATAAAAQEASVADLDAQQIEDIYEAEISDNAVTLYFRGALAGENIAEMLDHLYQSVDGLPTRLEVIEKNGSICQVLSEAKYPSPCPPYLPLVQRLSSIKNPDVIPVGQEVVFPQFDLNVFRSSRPFGKIPDAMLENIIANWGHLNIEITTSKRDQSTRIEFDTFELRITAPDSETRDNLVDNFLAVDIPDTYISTAGIGSKGGQIYQFNEDQVRDFCIEGSIQENPVDYSAYAGSAISDVDWGPNGISVADPEIVPRLYVLDVELSDTPNLLPDASAVMGWECEWQNWTPRYHSTHLAGIIASRTAKLGFVGLEPTTKIIDFPYRHFTSNTGGATDITEGRLPRIINQFSHENNTADDLAIFLMASSFRTPRENDYRQLDDPDERFEDRRRAEELYIKNEEPLLIVAAGQETGKDNKAMDIRTITDLAPQNLGDLKNVVSVAACVDCSKPSASIDERSNYSAEGLVHVAAPGGEKIPGWVNSDGIGASSGTSQSSAFAAGVAARMVARYPRKYKVSERVKLRLQTTSRPMVDENGDLVASAAKIATGIVDPRLAILDPDKDWLKTGSGWKPVQARYWSKKSVAFVDAAGNPDFISLERVRRVVQHEGGRFTIYQTARTSSAAPVKGAIERKHFFKIDEEEQPVELKLCDGTAILLGDVRDFLPRLGGLEVAPSSNEDTSDFGVSPCD
jgi:hypothetical protein